MSTKAFKPIASSRTHRLFLVMLLSSYSWHTLISAEIWRNGYVRSFFVSFAQWRLFFSSFFYVTGITAVVADPLSFIVLLYVPSGSVRKDEVAASTT